MPRLQGVDIPDNKRIEFALRYIYGIGPERASTIVREAELDPAMRARDLNEDQMNRITAVITEQGYMIEGDLRRDITANLKRLQSIQCLRGIRHRKGLPVRGQRTKTNARTRKGGRRSSSPVKRK